MTTPRYPSLYQINTRVWLTELSRKLGRPAMLGWSPETELKRSHWTKVQYTGSPASCIERITYSTAVKKKIVKRRSQALAEQALIKIAITSAE